jgi:hypothetical protein
LTGNVMGPFFYFAMTYSGAEEAMSFVAETCWGARARGFRSTDDEADLTLVGYWSADRQVHDIEHDVVASMRRASTGCRGASGPESHGAKS